MINTLKSWAFIGTLFLSTLSFSTAWPVTITIDSITGAWSNIIGGQNIQFNGANEVRWGGNNDPILDKSGYRFDAVVPSMFPVTLENNFNLGNFTHFNQPIPSGTGITGATLTATINMTIDGQSLTGLNFVYNFLHNETPNAFGMCPAGSVSTCDDIVSIVNNVPISDVFHINGVDYTVQISGFLIGGQTFNQFLTQENHTNVATLEAVVTSSRTDILVPEPSTYLILGSGLILCILLKRKQTEKV